MFGGKSMNKNLCKQYLRKAYKNAIKHGKLINEKNIEDEMRNIIKEQNELYIAYSKIAVYTIRNSANQPIVLPDLIMQIDILPDIYTPYEARRRSEEI